MAKRNIYKIGDNVLRTKCLPVVDFDDRLRQLLDDMLETMLSADGVGIAAPQVGVIKRAIIVSIDSGATVYKVVNPEIVKKSGSQTGMEGCLSVPNRREKVERPRRIEIKGFDENGVPIRIKASGFLAVAFCHEIDHLDGILFIDRVGN